MEVKEVQEALSGTLYSVMQDYVRLTEVYDSSGK